MSEVDTTEELVERFKDKFLCLTPAEKKEIIDKLRLFLSEVVHQS
ncbi:MAG: hypothetical protein N2Z57_05835 [Oscillospiraceae bacterium]|nr:hypothetical protein [Oscillospiraceae bacterium]